MREIKFRSWNKTLNRMNNWYDLVDKNLRNIFIMKDHNGYELMQYAGLKDKNGVEIYEGDILKLHYIKNGLEEIKASVVYSDDYAQYVIKDTKYVSDDYETLCDYEDLEIIGNIYDNPELLEKVGG